MATYRAYRIDRQRRFLSGEWISASSDAEAKLQAQELCEDGAPLVEVWRGSRLVDEIECADEDED